MHTAVEATQPARTASLKAKALELYRSQVPGKHRITAALLSRLKEQATTEVSIDNLDRLNKLLIVFRSASFIFNLINLASAYVIVLEQAGAHLGQEWILLASYITFILSKQIDFHFRNLAQESIKTILLPVLTDIVHGRYDELRSLDLSAGDPRALIAQITLALANAERSGNSLFMELASTGLTVGGGLFMTEKYDKFAVVVGTTAVFGYLFTLIHRKMGTLRKKLREERLKYAAASGRGRAKRVEDTHLPESKNQWAIICTASNMLTGITKSLLPAISTVQVESSEAQFWLTLGNLYLNLVIGFFFNRREAVNSLDKLEVLEGHLLKHLELRKLTMTNMDWEEIRERGLEQSLLSEDEDVLDDHLVIKGVVCQDPKLSSEENGSLVECDKIKIPLGKVNTIIGAKGSGKSMFCRRVAQETLHESSEQVWIGDKSIYECKSLDEVQQEASFYPCSDPLEYPKYSGIVHNLFDTALYRRPNSPVNDFYSFALSEREINDSDEIQEIVQAALQPSQSHKVLKKETSQRRQTAALRDWILYGSDDGERKLKEHEKSIFFQARESLYKAKLWMISYLLCQDLGFFTKEEVSTIIHGNLRERSPGQRALIIIAIALAENPRVMMLDEAFSRLMQESEHSSMTAISQEEVTIALTHYCNRGGTVVLISHQDQGTRQRQFQESVRDSTFATENKEIGLVDDDLYVVKLEDNDQELLELLASSLTVYKSGMIETERVLDHMTDRLAEIENPYYRVLFLGYISIYLQNFNALHGHEIELCIQQFVHSHYLEIYADEIREIADLQDGKKHGFIEIAISIAENRIINYDLYYSDRSNFRPLVRQYLYYIVTYFTTVRRLYGDEAVRNIGTYAALGFMPYYEDMREAYQDLNLPESEVLLYLTKSEVDELLSDVEVK